MALSGGALLAAFPVCLFRIRSGLSTGADRWLLREFFDSWCPRLKSRFISADSFRIDIISTHRLPSPPEYCSRARPIYLQSLDGFVLGVALLYLYLFVFWAVLIALMAVCMFLPYSCRLSPPRFRWLRCRHYS